MSIGSAFLLVALLLLSWFSGWDYILWNITQYIGPILFLMIWAPFSFSYFNLKEFYRKEEMQSIKRSIIVIIFGSILVVLGALLLNTRLLFIILNTLTTLFSIEPDNLVDQFVFNEIIVGILLPLNEEVVKIIPILVILQAKVGYFSTDVEVLGSKIKLNGAISTRRQFAFYGIISGTIFTFLELFLYQWQVSGTQTGPESIFFQILLRTFAPIHVVSTFYISLGIASLRLKSGDKNEDQFPKSLILVVLFMLTGYFFHCFWNSLNIFFTIFYPESELLLYGILLIFGILTNIVLFISIGIIFRYNPEICKSCGTEGTNHYHHYKTEEEEANIIRDKFNRFLYRIKILTRISKKTLKNEFSCPFCYNLIVLGTCQKCGSRTYVTCPHCNSFISETTSSCSNCKRRIRPLIQKQMLTMPETLILGLTSLASMAFLLAPFTILIFSQYFGSNSIFIPILIFYSLMGIIVLTNVIITLFINRTLGLLVLYCFFLELILLGFLILFGTLLNGMITSLVYLDIWGLIFIIPGLIVSIFVLNRIFTVFYFNFSPIFPEFQLDQIEEKIT